ncbi:MAG: hypothetical protein ACO1QS_18430 [Verrucomicrobiota bacterium]
MKPSEPSLTSWPRPHFQAGGGDAFLLYVVYGQIDRTAALSRSKYRCDGIPAGLTVEAYGPETHPDIVASFREGYLWEELKKNQPDLAARISQADSCLVLKGTFNDPPSLDYLRNTIGLITHFLDQGGVTVYDPQMFKWWAPPEWKEKIFEPASAAPLHHTVILVSPESDGTEWIHTRGLRKFGRPDISIHGVTRSYKEGALDLCERFIELQAFGGIVPDGKEIRMSSLPSGMKCRHKGSLDDPDFNNVHLEIGVEP